MPLDVVFQYDGVDVPVVVAGGGDGFFRTGTYVRYPHTVPTPYDMRHTPAFIGPGLSRFHVTCMRAMGLPDTTFGQPSIPLRDGTTHWLRDPLVERKVWSPMQMTLLGPEIRGRTGADTIEVRQLMAEFGLKAARRALE